MIPWNGTQTTPAGFDRLDHPVGLVDGHRHRLAEDDVLARRARP